MVVVGKLSPQLPLLGSAKVSSALAPPPHLETPFRGRIILVKGLITPLAPHLPFHRLPSLRTYLLIEMQLLSRGRGLA